MYSSITVCITRRRRFTTLEYQHAALGLLVTAAVAVYSQNDPHALPDIYWTPQRPKHCRVYMNFVCIHHNRMAIICIIAKTSRFTTKCKGNKVVCLKRRVFFEMAAIRHIGLVERAFGPPTITPSWSVFLCKICEFQYLAR